MAYLLGFEHDIFISYAHDNNLVGEGGVDGWVTLFHNQLQIALKQYARDLKVWRDPALRRNDLFDPEIKRVIDDSALFLVVHSHLHSQSPHCQQEILWFCDRAENDGWGLHVGNSKRIFNVLIHNIPDTEWHPAFSGAASYRFFEDEPGRNLGVPIDHGVELFKSELRTLVRDLFDTMRIFRELIEKKTKKAVQSDAAKEEQKFTIFLADASDNIRPTIRRRLIGEMEAKGLEVIHNIPPPPESALHDARAIEEIKRSQLCIHLFDASPGREIDDAPDEFYPHRQVQLAKKHAQSQWIWVSPSVQYENIEYEPHRNFLHTLENAERDASGYRFIREPLTADAVIRETLIHRQKYEDAMVASKAPIAAVLDAHFQDLSRAIGKLKPYLAKRQVELEVSFGDDDGPRQNIEKLAQKLKTASRLIMVFGQWEREQIDFRFREVIKICVDGKVKLPSCAIYFAHPRTLDMETRFDFGLGLPLHQFDDSNLEDALARWLGE